MINKKYFQTLRQDILTYAEKRREVIKVAGDAQHLAKKAIFALQRDERVEAAQSLKDALGLLNKLIKKYPEDARLFDEGSFKSAVEEYIEAALFQQFLLGGEIGPVPGVRLASESYVAGLCDLPGELLRYAIKSATAREFSAVKRCQAAAEAIVGELVGMDLTGYHRQKFDQAKQALHKLEQVVYEVSLRTGGEVYSKNK